MRPRFVHLHIHTEYSICDGLIRIEPLLQRCVTLGMPAIAITDQNNFFGLVKFYKTAFKLGIKPIIGVDIWLADQASEKPATRLVLLAQNEDGYQNLLNLVSRSYLQGQKLGTPIIDKTWLIEKAHGLIALAGKESDIGQTLLRKDRAIACDLLKSWLKVFPNCFYLELQRTEKSYEENYIQEVLDLAKEYDTPVVATNNACFMDRDDFEAHEARVCIHASTTLSDSKRPHLYSEEQYLRSPDEMIALFHDIPEAIENSVEIAKRCNVTINLEKNFLPVFPLPEGEVSLDDYFTNQARAGLEQRLAKIFDSNNQIKPHNAKKTYEKRLQHEIEVIRETGFVGYFLIVADFIQWAKNNDIPVGPGRGSGAGSLVAYALNITDPDPLEHELLFERFLNPERVSLPDFDIDFCMDGRDRVIEYVMNRHGHDRVAQIVTHGTMAAKAVVRDVGRVLAYPYGFVDKIAKLIPFTLGITLRDALREEVLLKKRYAEEEEVRTLIDLALKIEGITRNVGKHAGGVVIAPTKLTDFTPIYCEADGEKHVITQFDKDDVEAIGLVKFDFLGLRTLTIIASAVKTINLKRKKNGEPLLDITLIPLDDPATYQLIKSGATTAIFQIESRGMQELTKRLQPDRFSDIAALVALYRPGPLQSGMVEDFIDRKYGRAKVSYLHPLLEPILRPTYGVILYQEQVMQIAQVLAGFSLGSADILRHAMGKKKQEEMARQRAIFLDGATKRGIDKHVANNIFDLMENFAGYGFNKSHSVAYALIAYQTAWLKAHYPAEFMAAVLSSDMDNTDKIVKLIAECKNMGLKIIPPDINLSDYRFTVDNDGNIIYGLGAIKGAGQIAIENLTAIRNADGAFKDFFDLCIRADRRKVNRKILEALIKSGALDKIIPHRASAICSIDNALQLAEQKSKEKGQKQLNLLDLFDLDEENEGAKNGLYAETRAWSSDERLSNEKDTLGFYLQGHPIEHFTQELRRFIKFKISDLASNINQSVLIAGFVTKVRAVLTKTNKQLAIVTLEDDAASIDAVVFSDLYLAARDLLQEDQLIIVAGETDMDNFSGNVRLRAKEIFNLEKAREKYGKHLLLKIKSDLELTKIKDELLATLKPYLSGNFPIFIDYFGAGANARIALGPKWQVTLKNELLEKLAGLLGGNNVLVEYA